LTVITLCKTMSARRETPAQERTPSKPDGEVSSRDAWGNWSDALHAWGLDGIAGWLLEAAGPLALVSAQLIYAGRPFLGGAAQRVARLLESDTESAAFADFLVAEAGLEGSRRGRKRRTSR
jgi:hypothetical protein